MSLCNAIYAAHLIGACIDGRVEGQSSYSMEHETEQDTEKEGTTQWDKHNCYNNYCHCLCSKMASPVRCQKSAANHSRTHCGVLQGYRIIKREKL